MKFCGECGTPLLVAVGVAAAPVTAERRLVSVLFIDLVGFTAAFEGRDAEETREFLSDYFEMARTIVGRYGGTVEKFIGDAVMAVWGTPVAREDDAERAVRAALDLVSAVPELDHALQARAGVLTGEAAVTFLEGEGMVAGDLVNAASRVQSVADPGTVLVGEATKRASEAAVAYEDDGEHDLKGITNSVRLWRAVRVVANRGGERRSSTLEAPFVGRGPELRLVKELFHACADDRRATLLSVVGVAGVGKSRLAWELEKHLDGIAERVWWHRGRCLAYGEGVAFWALAEMVRMRAGIAGEEPAASARQKLAAAVDEHIVDPGERAWVEPLLGHLLGLGERHQVERADLFAAWRLFFERMSDSAAVVLVFEDLHWADTALLDFIEELLEWSRARPVFVLALSRPDLLERRGTFAARSRNSTTLVLEPLDDAAMDALVDGLVPGLPDELRTRIRERADGIPLYAVETVRMLLDRGALSREGDALRVAGTLDQLDIPETLQALIGARLDGLEPAERLVVQHASVLGKTFRAEGVAALGAVEVGSLRSVLDRLVRKELLTIDADPRSPERGRYGFLQALVQRVAYETLARRERGRLHRAAASFLEHDAGIDADAIAEVIAAHHRDAYEAEPNGSEAAASRRAARAWLERAAERAALLGAPDDGLRAYDDAAALAEEPSDRARMLELAGRLALRANRPSDGEQRLRTAVELFTAAEEKHAAARAAASLGLALWHLNRSDEALALLRPAFDALAHEERDVDVGKLAAEIARIEFFAGELDRAREHIELALDVAEKHAEFALLSDALNTKSLLLRDVHPHERHALLHEAMRIAEEHDLTEPMLRSINNLIVLALETDRHDEVDALLQRGITIARTRGYRYHLTWTTHALISRHLRKGTWDEAFALADDAFPGGAIPTTTRLTPVLLAKASFDRGDDDGAREWIARLPVDIEATNLVNVGAAIYRDALSAFLDGRFSDGVDELTAAWDHHAALHRWPIAGHALFWAADAAVLLADSTDTSALADRYDTAPPSARTRALRAAGGRLVARRAAAAHDDDAAAEAFADALAAARDLGQNARLAPVLADYGLWLSERGRDDEAEPLLDEARALFAEMGARRWLERIHAPLHAHRLHGEHHK